MYPDFLHGAPPAPTCAAFIKESRIRFVNANKADRKSGVRFGDRISCYPALDIAACADFIEEIRMKCADAKNLDRKSGEHGAPVLLDLHFFGV